MRASKPRYQQLKDDIIEQISSGDLQPSDRVPSENELVESKSVSRMTANRALRELTDEGYVERIAGRGTYVSDYRSRSHLLEVRNIAEEIASRGHEHTSRVIRQESCRAEGEIARALNIAEGTEVIHLLLVHLENAAPIQVEDRYVLASFAPRCLDESFASETPSAYLTSIAPLQEAEQSVRASLADREVCRLLEVSLAEPCLVVIRRTWSEGHPVTFARLFHPGSRFELAGHYTPPGTPRTTCADVIDLEKLHQ